MLAQAEISGLPFGTLTEKRPGLRFEPSPKLGHKVSALRTMRPPCLSGSSQAALPIPFMAGSSGLGRGGALALLWPMSCGALEGRPRMGFRSACR